MVKLEDVLHTAIEKAKTIMEEKSPHLENRDEVAQQVGVGAVVFGVLYNARIKDIAFSYERALSFEGETAPYVQYTHARCTSVLRKAGTLDAALDMQALCGEFAFPVVRLCESWPQTLVSALEKNEPYLVARHLVELAQAYNRFYYEVRILDEENAAQTAARLTLTRAVKTVLSTGLGLLGIGAPERM